MPAKAGRAKSQRHAGRVGKDMGEGYGSSHPPHPPHLDTRGPKLATRARGILEAQSAYDCLGGPDNGPQFTWTVQVSGSDPYGLDADGNGAGCEYDY